MKNLSNYYFINIDLTIINLKVDLRMLLSLTNLFKPKIF